MVHPWMSGVVVVGGTDSGAPVERPPEKPQPRTDNPEITKLTKEISDLKNQVTELKMENRQLKITIDSKDSIISDLRKQVENLNKILMEQVKVIYEWVTSR
jgi:predicted RNase H-like nuclease (RuvC/YqgF family)